MAEFFNPSGLVQAAQVNAQTAPLGLFSSYRKGQQESEDIRSQNIKNFDSQQLSDLTTLVQGASVLSTIDSLDGKWNALQRIPVPQGSQMQTAFDEYGALLQKGDLAGAQQAEQKMIAIGAQLNGGSAMGVQEQFFEHLTANMTPEQKQRAREIQVGLEQRDIGSAEQTIARNKTAEEVGDVQQILAQRTAVGTGIGKATIEHIDKAYDTITNITKGLQNLDRAKELVSIYGADTGPWAQHLPSFFASTVELDQLQNAMALDVINSVTLGAISEKELDVAQQVALPKGLDGPALLAWIDDKKAAQTKLVRWYEDQIEWLEKGGPDGKGGTIASFVRMKKKEANGRKQSILDAYNMTDASFQQYLKDHPNVTEFEGLDALENAQGGSQ